MKSIFVGGKTEKARTSYQWEALLVPRLGYTWLPSSKRSYGDISVSYEAINKVDYVYGREFENSHPAFMDIKKRRLGLNVTFLGGFVF